MPEQTGSGSSYRQQSFGSHTPAPREVCSKPSPLRKGSQRTDAAPAAAAIFGLLAEHVGNALRLQGRGAGLAWNVSARNGCSPSHVWQNCQREAQHTPLTSNNFTCNVVSHISCVILFLNGKTVLRHFLPLTPPPHPIPEAKVNSSK